MAPKQPKKDNSQSKLTAFKFGFLKSTDQASPPQPVASVPTPAPLPPLAPKRRPGRPRKDPAASVLNPVAETPLHNETVEEHQQLADAFSEVVTVQILPLQQKQGGGPVGAAAQRSSGESEAQGGGSCEEIKTCIQRRGEAACLANPAQVL